MKRRKHFEKKERKMLKRAMAILCTVVLLALMIPQGAFPVWAAGAEGLTVAVTPNLSKIVLGDGYASSEGITLSLGNTDVNYNYSYEWQASSSDLVDVSVSGDVVTFTPKTGKYGEGSITITASNLKKTLISNSTDITNIEGDVSVTFAVKVYYKPVLTLSLLDGEEEISVLSQIPYGKTLTASVSDTSAEDLEFETTYTWEFAGGSTVTGASFVPASVGSGTVTASGTISAETPNAGYLAAPENITQNFTVVKAEPHVEVSVPALMYGDSLSGKMITVSSDAAGTITFTASGKTLTLAEQADESFAGSIAGTGILNVSAATSSAISLAYQFDASDSNYDDVTSSVEYTVDKRDITVNVVPSPCEKNFDNTTVIAGTLADSSNTAAAEGIITYSLATTDEDTRRVFTGDNANSGWQITGSTLKLENAGDVNADASVGIIAGSDDFQIAFSDGAGGYTAPSDNYNIIISGEMTVKKVVLTDEEVSRLSIDTTGAYENNGTLWYPDGTTSMEISVASGTNTVWEELGDPDDSTNWGYNASASIVPNESGSLIFYVKEADGSIAQATWGKQVGVDSTAPAITLDSVVANNNLGSLDLDDDEVQYTFSLSDAESGIEKVYYAITKTEPGDGFTGWQEIELSEGNCVEFSVTAPGDGFVSIKASDHVGNISEEKGIRAFRIEGNAPEITVEIDGADALANDFESTVTQTHSIEIHATDLPGTEYSGVKTITYTFLAQDGQETGDVEFEVEQENQPTSLEQLASCKELGVTVDLSGYTLNGQYELQVTAVDYCGNTSEVAGILLNFDNEAPAVSVEMGETDYYYNAKNCGVTIKIADNYTEIADLKYVITLSGSGEDDSVLWSIDEGYSGSDVKVTKNFEDKLVTLEINADTMSGKFADGEVVVTCTATDKVFDGEDDEGEPLYTSNETSSFTVKGMNYREGDDEENDSASFILDTKSPKLTLKVETGAVNKGLQTSYGNRFYLNDSFRSSLSIDDAGGCLSADKITIQTGFSGGSNYMNDSVSPKTKVSVDGSDTVLRCSGFSGDSDGLYIISVVGTDRAGNPIECSASSSLDSNPFQTTNNSTGSFISYVIVIDRETPTAAIAIGNYYAATLTNGNYSVSANMPYRKEKSAVFQYNSSDRSPVLLEYQLYSSIADPGPSKSGGNYAMNESGQYVIEGEQIFAIETLSVTDLAGNRLTAPQSVDGRVSNLIYLDVTAPNEDQLAPTVRYVAHESGQGRSQSGVELYSSTVTVDAVITDPGYSNEKGGKSSGLYAVYYEVLHNDSEDWTDRMSGRVHSAANGETSGAVYYASGSSYTETKNEKLTGTDTLTFTFDAADFNYNDISIRVWAEDNSGNLLGKNNVAIYRFGIDTTSPSIQVTYDNNDVQNERYFKADRTATVVVRERNFDPDHTVITGAGAAISGWSYSMGTSANGDDDAWTCTVSYVTDGDYTFNVTSSDLVGHAAGAADFSGSAAPQDFTLDKTVPVIEVTFDNEEAANQIYYKDPRTATFSIVEHNFESSAAQVSMTAEIVEGETSIPTVSAWVSAGDGHTATALFDRDGDYTIDVSFTDLAGNQAEPVSVSKFVIDQTAPTLEIGGVEDKHAYKDMVIAPSIVYHDVNYDSASAGITISGYLHADGKNLPGKSSDDRFGGSFICDNIEVVKENDDVYTVTGSVSDLAGNKTEATLMFSINRFGSTYMLSEATKALTEKVYTNHPESLQITEINVNSLVEQSVTVTLNGNTTTLTENTDYSVNTSNPGWVQTDYTIYDGNFQEEGPYVVKLLSEDEAGNHNSNDAIKENGNEKSVLPVGFYVDMTPPECVITGVMANERYNAAERNIAIRFDDNTAVAKIALYINDELIQEYDSEALADFTGELTYLAKAANKWQEMRVVLTDLADNTNEISSGRYLLTTNLWIQYINNLPLLIGSITAAAAFAGAVILLIKKGRLKR